MREQAVVIASDGCPAWLAAAEFTGLPRRVPGSYVLVVHLDNSGEIRAGSLPERTYQAGWYAYAGSALNGLGSRLGRYVNTHRKKHWHIDYLLENSIIDGAVIVPGRERLECRLADYLAEHMETVIGFGSSDCRCPGHLFFHENAQVVKAVVTSALLKRF